MIDIKEIAQAASDHNICKPGLERILNSKSIDDVMKYYIEGIDFCLNENFPSVEYFEKYGKGQIEKYGVFVNDKVDIKNKKVTVLLGESNGTIEIDGFHISEIFIKHTSSATITAKDNAYVVIDCFDDSEVFVLASEYAKVLLNVYGNAKISIGTTDSAIIKVIRKGKNKY